MKKAYLTSIFAVLFLLLLATTAHAVVITDCQNISASGVYTLSANVAGNNFWEDTDVYGAPNTQCLRVTANDVELNGNGFTLQTSASDGIEVVGGLTNISIHDIKVFTDSGGQAPLLSDSEITVRNTVLNGSTSSWILTQRGSTASFVNVYGESTLGLEIDSSPVITGNNVTFIASGAAVLENQGDPGDTVSFNGSFIKGTFQYDGSQGASLTITNTTLNGSFSSSNDITNGALLHNTYVNPTNTGFSQTCVNVSGICSTPYDLSVEAAGSTLTDSQAIALTPGNVAPTLNTVTLTATANNQTLIASANASDLDNNTITYFWRLFRNNTLISSGSNGTFTQGVLRNFNNYSTSSVDGTYIVEVFASDGSLNSSRTNSSAVTVTFPGVLNTAPTLITVTLAATSNNQTLIANANATDAQNNSLTYFWRLFRNNTLVTSGSNSAFPAGLLRNFHNFSTSSVDGTYIVEVLASDGLLNSSRLNSSGVTVTFPSTPVPPPTPNNNADIDHAIIIWILLTILLILYFTFLAKFINDEKVDHIVIVLAAIIFIISMLTLIF